MFSLTLLLAILLEAKCLVPQATSASIGQSIRYELLLAANNGKSNTAFIPRCKADLEDILVNDASQKLRNGDLVDESNVKFAKTIHVLPFHYSVSGYSGNLIEDYVTPYFLNSYRVVSLGDTFSTRGGEWAPQFKIVSIEGCKRQDGESYIVGPNTKIVRARGVVEESGPNTESQFQDGSARPFHVSTVSDIPSNILSDKTFNRMYGDNIENKNQKISGYRKSATSISNGELSLADWFKEDDKSFKKFILWKYRNCATVLDLLIATGGEDLLDKFDTEKGINTPASVILEIFFVYQQDLTSVSSILIEHGIPPAICHSIYKSLLEEAKVFSLNSLEVQLGKGMAQQGIAAQKYLLQKYENCDTIIDLLEFIQVPRDLLSQMPIAVGKISAITVIGYFTQIHKMSFLDKMEEVGVPFPLSIAALLAFNNDMINLPIQGPGRRWPFRALIKSIISGVVSLFNRPQSNI